MKVRNLCILALSFIALGVQASTPFKNLYVAAEVYPSGAGEVYLTTKESDKPYIKYETGEYGERVELKYTCGENGSQDQYTGSLGYVEDGTGTLGMFEAVIKVRPKEGYEFVCVATELSPTDIYDPTICLQRHTGDRSADYKFYWNYEIDADNYINVNVSDEEHPVDFTSDEGSQEDCFNNAVWNNEPDRTVYVIFRKIGDETPCFEDGRISDLIGDVDGNEEVNMEDAKALAEFLVWNRTEVNKEYCDVNGDNEINIADVIAIIKNLQKKQ